LPGDSISCTHSSVPCHLLLVGTHIPLELHGANHTVYFLYPETANVRLEDMNSLFGDATSVMPTPETIAEAELLFSGNRSPVPSLDINSRRQGFLADNAIPGLNIDPPSPRRPSLGSRQGSGSRGRDNGEGVGGWISNMVARARGADRNGNGESSTEYSRVGQRDDNEEQR
jgi:hypothetical protein